MNTRISRGFTLLELLVVLAIAAMLTMLATDGYAAVRARASRHEVRMALWRLAAAQEAHRLSTGVYATRLASTPGAPAAPYELPVPALPPADWRIDLLDVGEENWALRAAAANPAKDPECAELRLDVTGLGTARASDGRDTSSECWRR